MRPCEGPRSRRCRAHHLKSPGLVTANSSENAPDRYRLRLARHGKSISRQEEFTFQRKGGRGRRITVSGDRVTIYEDDQETFSRSLASSQTTGLATLPKLSDSEGGLGIRSFTEFLSQILVFEPDVSAARQPAREHGATITQDAGNLADALNRIRMRDPDSWELLTQELARCLPGLQSLQLVPVGGAAKAVSVQLRERGVIAPIDLADASYGTVRLLALLAALHEPDPPPFIAIEEIDHGLHPYAMDVLLDRLRAASRRTQILAATERARWEAAFAEARDCVIVATSTLELGVNVGDLDRVIQLNAPRTVASFLQQTVGMRTWPESTRTSRSVSRSAKPASWD